MSDQDKNMAKWNFYRSMTASCLISLLFHSCIFTKLDNGVLNVHLNDTFIIHSKENRKLQDNQDFLVRHKRTPRDRHGINIVGLDNYCKPGTDGLYGEMSSSEAEVSYFYEMEIEKSDMVDSMMSAVNAVERRINDDLANLFFPSCRNRGRKLRGFQNMVSGYENKMHHGRLLLVEGLTPIPADVTQTSVICRSSEAPLDSECSLVIGGLTLYFDGDTDDSERKNTLMQVQLFIEEKITRNTYSTTFEGIRRITYIPPSDNNPFEPGIELSLPEVRDEEIEETNETDETSNPGNGNINFEALRSDHNLSAWLSALIALAGVVIPLGLVHMWRERRGAQQINRTATSYSMVDSIISIRHQPDDDPDIMHSIEHETHQQTIAGSMTFQKLQDSQDDEEKSEVPTLSIQQFKIESDPFEEHFSVIQENKIVNYETKHQKSSKKQRSKKTKEEKKKGRKSSRKVYMADDIDEENSVINDEIADLDKSRKEERKERNIRKKGKKEKKSRKQHKDHEFEAETLIRNNSEQKVSNSELYGHDYDEILNLGLLPIHHDQADRVHNTKSTKPILDIANQDEIVHQHDLENLLNLTDEIENQDQTVQKYDLKNLLNLTDEIQYQGQIVQQHDLEKILNLSQYDDDMDMSYDSGSSEENSEYSFEDKGYDTKKKQNLLDDFSVSSPDLSSLMESTQVSPTTPEPFQSQLRPKRRMSAIEELSSNASTLDRSSKLQDIYIRKST